MLRNHQQCRGTLKREHLGGIREEELRIDTMMMKK